MSSFGYNLEDLSSPSAQVMKLIRNEIYNNVTTAFLAEVTEVKTSKEGKAIVDVKLLNTDTFNGEETEAQEVKGLAVGILGVKKWLINIPIDKGDIGLCIACKWDISGYMETGKGGLPQTSRTFNIGDAIFIPLSMYLQSEIKEDFTLTETGGDEPNAKITLKSDGSIEVMNKKDIKVDTEGSLTLSGSGDNSAVNITVKKDVVLKSENGGVTVSCGDDKKLEITSSEITLTDGNNSIKLGSSGVTINDNLTVMK